MEIGQIRRAALILIIATATVAYIQFVSMERWSQLWHVRSRSPVVNNDNPDYLDVFPTQDLNVVYFDPEDSYNGSLNVLRDNADQAGVITNDIDEEELGFDVVEKDINNTVQAISSIYNSKLATLDLNRFIFNNTDFNVKPLMLMFTSWEYTEEKEPAHEMLRKAWLFWPGLFKPLVMTRDKLVQQQARKSGWMYQSVTAMDKECHGPPILSTMFTDLYKKHDAFFYGYSNADIIYGDGLEKTMKYLYYNYPAWKTRPLLIVGRRHNIDFMKYTNDPLNSPENISAITKEGQLVIRSTDYFFTNRRFPWSLAPKVSIGKVWVVRAIIGWALKQGYIVIDATRTIQAVHLTTHDGVFASWYKQGAMCNERILANLNWSIPTSSGHCECARLETYHTRTGEVRIRHRPPSKKICTKKPQSRKPKPAVAMKPGVANPAQAQQANPAQAQQAKPPQAQQANPAQAKQVEPPQAQQVKPPQGQQVKPPQDQQVKPPQGQQVKPPQGQQVKPPQGQQVKPPN